MSDFFDFGSRFALVNFLAGPEELNFKTEVDDGLKLIKGDYKFIKFPVVFKQDKESGKRFSDILDTGHPNLYLISDRMKTVLEENNLTGWKTYPIKLYDKKGNEIFGYHGFSIVGRCEKLSYERSEVIKKSYVPNGPICKFYKGIDVIKWDGSDFFTPKETYHIIITKKVSKILEKEKITNLELVNLFDAEVDVDNIPPGRRKKNSENGWVI